VPDLALVHPTPEKLTAFVLGRLAGQAWAEVATHLDYCPTCCDQAASVPADGLVEGLRLTCHHEVKDEDAKSLAAGHAETALPSLPGVEMVEELGRGGMGVVYKVIERALGRTAALKVLATGAFAGPEELSRFLREADTLARVHHPNIVSIYRFEEGNGAPYFLMEYVSGGNLAQKWQSRPQPPSAVAALLAVVARAVDHAHQQGVVHRDLKPANILLASPARESEGLIPKITDFGLAKRLEVEAGQTRTGAVLGTPSYMAPEQAEGKPGRVGPATDVYTLGAVLYEGLTGRPPFLAATYQETMAQLIEHDAVPPRKLQPQAPRDLETIALKCLEKEPRRRYATALALAEDVERWMAGVPIMARPVGVWERVRKWVGRHPSSAGLLLVSAVSLVTLVTGVLIYNARLVSAVARAETGEARAREQQLRADGNYRKAREAIDAMLLRTHDRASMEIPQLRELRRQQAEDALRFFRAAVDQQAEPDPVVRFELARAIVKLADRFVDIGRVDEGLSNYREALAVFDELVAADPTNQEMRFQRAYCQGQLGFALLWQRPKEAEPSLLGAVAGLEDLQRELPTNAQLLERLALSYHNYGMLCRRSGRLPEAEKLYRRAIEQYAFLLAEPTDGIRNKLADSWIGVGLVCWQTKRFANAAEAYSKAEEQLTAIRSSTPHNLDAAAALGALCINWGLLLQDENKSEEALVRFDQAVKVLEAAYKQEPKFQRLPQALYNAHGARGTLLHRLGRKRESAVHFERQADFYAPDRKPAALLHAACQWVQAGDAEASVAVLRRLRDSDRHAWPKRVAEIMTRAELAPLRQSPEFQKLLLELEVHEDSTKKGKAP
jgi:tetratricopeptide (TPR) repeat protein